MCDFSALDKEATNFAFSTGNDQQLELVRLCWEACFAYMYGVLERECEGTYALDVLDQLVDAPQSPKQSD